MDEMANVAELAIKEAKAAELRKIINLALKADANGETLSDFIAKLEAMDKD